MKKLFAIVAPATLLAGCGAAEGDGVEAGQWSFTVRAAGMEAPNAPPAAQQAMERQLQSQQDQVTSECFTQAQADNFAASLDRFSGNDDCEVTSSEVGDGQIRIEGTCSVPGVPGESSLVMSGTYDRTSIDADIELVMDAPPLGEVTVLAELEGAHEGEC